MAFGLQPQRLLLFIKLMIHRMKVISFNTSELIWFLWDDSKNFSPEKTRSTLIWVTGSENMTWANLYHCGFSFFSLNTARLLLPSAVRSLQIRSIIRKYLSIFPWIRLVVSRCHETGDTFLNRPLYHFILYISKSINSVV